MGDTLKRFLANKNTVTLIAIIVMVVVLYLFYNWRVKQAVSTTTVCYAAETIPARTLITDDMVSERTVLSEEANAGNVIKDCSEVVGKYASYATEIPVNSLFFDENIMTEEEMPDAAFNDIPDGYTVISYKVDNDATYGNSIFPDDYIDIYLKTEDASEKLIYGKFVQSIKVLAVKDADGRNVFETTVEQREAAYLLFAVPDDLFLLLSKANFLGMEMVIVPRNNNYTEKAGETLVSSDFLKQIVLERTAEIPDECVKTETGIAECKLDDDTTENKDNNNQTESKTESGE